MITPLIYMVSCTCYWINLDVRVSSRHIFFPVSLSDIHEVRSGHETDTFRISKNQSKYPKEKCFSLITGADNHTVNLVAPSQEDAKVWIHGLRWLKKKSQHIDIHAKQAAYPLQHWLSYGGHKGAMAPPVDWRVPPPPKKKKKGRELVCATTRNLSLIMTFNVQCHFDVHKVLKTSPYPGRCPSHLPALPLDGVQPPPTPYPFEKILAMPLLCKEKGGGGGCSSNKKTWEWLRLWGDIISFRARRTLMLFKDVPLRTRRALDRCTKYVAKVLKF